MSYHIYTTKGLILSARPLREADRLYSILTRDLGLIQATATGVRKEVSKLRGALEPITLAQVSLVRGKDHWRITSAEVLQTIPHTTELVRPLALLEKLVQGEHIQPEFFDAVVTHLNSAESTLVAQMLFQLGYLKEADLRLEPKDLIKAINKGLEASHLI